MAEVAAGAGGVGDCKRHFVGGGDLLAAHSQLLAKRGGTVGRPKAGAIAACWLLPWGEAAGCGGHKDVPAVSAS